MLALGVSSPAFACAVCGGAGQNQQAFLETMVFMTLMPVLMLSIVAGVVWYLWRKAEQAAAEDAREELVAQG